MPLTYEQWAEAGPQDAPDLSPEEEAAIRAILDVEEREAARARAELIEAGEHEPKAVFRDASGKLRPWGRPSTE
jgi:hypothetical protein